MDVILIIVGYLIVINILGFLTFGMDKRRAKRHAFRVPEATLFTIAIIGGSIGSLFGMHFFHHKTRHWYFVYGIPFILILQIGLFIFLHNSSITISIL